MVSKREFLITEDGSHTLYVPELKEHYHSTYGAIQESKHVYIDAGLNHLKKSAISILEAGFGTGLNALLSLLYAQEKEIKINYHSIEKYPLTQEEFNLLNYENFFSKDNSAYLKKLHTVEWEKETEITPSFTLHKYKKDFREVDFNEKFDLVFYDAFNPDVQPHLWSKEVLSNFYKALKLGGILTTYCVKGEIKKHLRNLGFTIERLPGPPGKRHMLRATKQ
ncbi:MAG: tRNA (5-methylaminomethyl-2-thiouridine)(34)-methyltransferase MnmD [Odoribacter sp.]|nr:tRNA (5-methylaminomethyl-2-thiouridine)(34)-methyltransferase MnmD [Odoribacter sp.]